jgi:hypothetical protein
MFLTSAPVNPKSLHGDNAKQGSILNCLFAFYPSISLTMRTSTTFIQVFSRLFLDHRLLDSVQKQFGFRQGKPNVILFLPPTK